MFGDYRFNWAYMLYEESNWCESWNKIAIYGSYAQHIVTECSVPFYLINIINFYFFSMEEKEKTYGINNDIKIR